MTIREAASDYREEVRDGIAHIAIWRRKWSGGHKTWCALAFWADELNDNCEPVFSKEDAEELKAIVAEDCEKKEGKIMAAKTTKCTECEHFLRGKPPFHNSGICEKSGYRRV